MFVKRYGTGPRAFLGVHGWSGDHRSFEPLIAHLPEDATFWSVDLPGCGISALPRKFALAAVARELACEVRRVGPAVVVGNCMGALLALRAALEPESAGAVSRLVLVDAPARWPWYFRVFTAPGWGRYAYLSTFANPVGRWIANRSLARKRTRGSHLTAGFARARHDSTLAYLNLLREIRSPREFAAIAVPIAVVHGERTFRAIRESAAVWAAMWPQAVVTELKGAAHLPLQEAPEALAGIVFEGQGAARNC